MASKDAAKVGALLLIGGVVALVAASSKAGGGGELGPNDPVLQGATVILNGLGKTPAGITIRWRIEQLAGGGDYVGIVFKPWENDTPVNVAQGPDKAPVQDGVLNWIASQEQGLPG